MNLLLFRPEQREDTGQLRIDGRQHRHLLAYLNAEPGDTIKVGEIGGQIGRATVLQITASEALLEVTLERAPPAAVDITLILALPRPKMLKRIFQTAASLGIKTIHLVNSYRVEKSYWQTPWLAPGSIEEQLILGLEQSCDTVLPQVHLHKRFKPFVEDQLPKLIENTTPLVAHPYTDTPCPTAKTGPVSLAIGPEGGFIPYEVDKLEQVGFQTVSLGPRILRVETAIPVLVSRLTAC
ncbi:MAG: 16S rRNA (uracil(1498)-N(3))-methyltransferase [Porticoccaceae bacterium]|nr:16S rRNA (uracil(1498)-N(3))-methyltransferase [Porticoccaceae bacterium]